MSETSQSSMPPPQTMGQKRVRASFNPEKNSIVDQIKQKSADLIDFCEAIKNEDAVSPEGRKMDPASFRNAYGEKHRLLALAQTAYEEAAMWAVKAATS